MNAAGIIPANRALSLTKALEYKGKELAAEDCEVDDVLQDYYRENCSEGSGQYDVADLRETIKTTPIEPKSLKAVKADLAGADREFMDTVIGCVVEDALSAITNNPAIAAALTVAMKK